jgi:hypothetical protein
MFTYKIAIMKTFLSISILCLSCSLLFSQCEQQDISFDGSKVITEGEIESLKYLREEEFLAGDVYDHFAEIYSVPVFKNIGKSEDVHTEKVRELLEYYEIEDPSLNHKPGEFINQELQLLYNSLIEKGELLLDSAIVVGLRIEEKDIFDLKEALTHIIKSENIRQVYEFLLMGSHNHLRAFHSHSLKREIRFIPQYLSPEEFTSALSR